MPALTPSFSQVFSGPYISTVFFQRPGPVLPSPRATFDSPSRAVPLSAQVGLFLSSNLRFFSYPSFKPPLFRLAPSRFHKTLRLITVDLSTTSRSAPFPTSMVLVLCPTRVRFHVFEDATGSPNAPGIKGRPAPTFLDRSPLTLFSASVY